MRFSSFQLMGFAVLCAFLVAPPCGSTNVAKASILDNPPASLTWRITNTFNGTVYVDVPVGPRTLVMTYKLGRGQSISGMTRNWPGLLDLYVRVRVPGAPARNRYIPVRFVWWGWQVRYYTNVVIYRQSPGVVGIRGE